MKPREKQNSFPRGPKYLHVATRLRAGIADGTWAPGARLPVERELADSLSVSVNTLRRAVGELVEEGVVQRRQGAGTFVAPRPGPPAPVPGAGAPGGRRLVGVLVPSTTYYFPRVVDGIQRVLRDAGASVLLTSSKYDLAVEREELRALLDGGVSGLLLVPNLHLMDDPQAYVDGLRELPVPYVLVERCPPDPEPDDPTPYVGTDHAGGVFRAVRHLHGLGHERIGFLGRLRTGTADTVARGFDDAAGRFGVTGTVDRQEVWTADGVGGYLRRCLEDGVTAVFCHGDRDAAALVVAARRHGLSVPGDFAVVAHDDEVAEVGDVPLTAVSPPKEEVGAFAARLLVRHLTGEDGPPACRVRMQPPLVVRASCGGSASRPDAARRVSA
ncbi:GntR family transcriptional regulator [Streptomyces parvulus]|uniref:GntR family transcriptional regulator n=1 Tax=Streptomyces parvulus TaxID=146923 RepID=UPI0033D8D1D6